MSQVVENRLEVGDLVRVIDADSLLHGLEGRIAQTDFGAGADPYKFESVCGEHRGWLSAYQLRKLTATSVEGEPYVAGKALLLRSNWNAEKGCFETAIVQPATDHNADPTKTANPSETPNSSSAEPLAIPEGWRELEPDEVPKTGDDVDIDGQWIDLLSDCNVESRYYSRRIIRKIEPANPSETPNSLTWIPRVGDKVRVVNKASVFAGKKGSILDVSEEGSFTIYFVSEDEKLFSWVRPEHLELIEATAPTDHNADANKMVPPAIPAGWRELFDGETRSKTDLYCERGRWKSFVDFDPAGSDFPKYDKTLHCQHIRKIETANTSEVPNSSLPVAELVKGLSQAMQHDQDLAWTWHCSIATASCDEGACPSVANLAAARFMRIAFGVDVTTFDQWKSAKRASAQLVAETPDHIADANKMVPPTGYRLLDKSAKVEPRKWGDLFWSSKIADWKILSALSEQEANRDDWPACRKIEEPAKEPETQYREPTLADLVNGPIDVEVCDDTNCDLNWQKRQLYAVLPSKCMYPYVVNDPGDEEFTQHWRHARIKVKATLHIKSDTRDVENLLSDAEVINATSINFEPKRPLVYIAGPMRGIPHFNFPAFDAAKAYLMEKGYDVLSPADFDRELDGFDPYKPEYETAEGCADFPKTMDFKRVVTRDLTAVTQCDAVALLSGWEKSKGAVAEIAVAHWMGKPVMHLLCDANRPNEVVYIVNNDSTTLEQFVLQLAHAHDAYDKRINCAIDTPPPELNPDCDILEVAASITLGDRQAVYGPPDQDFKKTADMWTGMFQYMLAPGAKFEPRHVAMAMICIKLSREFHQRKRDNWIDIAGYARCGSLCSS